MVNLNQKVQFTPLEGIKFSGCSEVKDSVIGKVDYINKRHRWFSVVYGENIKLRTSFHFNDIGTKVYLH